MRVYKLEETACDVCLDIFAELRVKPHDVALSVPAWLLVTCGMYSSLWLKLLRPSSFCYVCILHRRVLVCQMTVNDNKKVLHGRM